MRSKTTLRASSKHRGCIGETGATIGRALQSEFRTATPAFGVSLDAHDHYGRNSCLQKAAHGIASTGRRRGAASCSWKIRSRICTQGDGYPSGSREALDAASTSAILASRTRASLSARACLSRSLSSSGSSRYRAVPPVPAVRPRNAAPTARPNPTIPLSCPALPPTAFARTPRQPARSPARGSTSQYSRTPIPRYVSFFCPASPLIVTGAPNSHTTSGGLPSCHTK